MLRLPRARQAGRALPSTARFGQQYWAAL